MDAQPDATTGWRFPPCNFAVFPMSGRMPQLGEPWDEIRQWYPPGQPVNTMTLRCYDEVAGTGEVWIPMQPYLAPTPGTHQADTT